MNETVVVIGSGMGGLAAAIRLANAGFEVHVFEARSNAGGLASGVQYDGFMFDAGPYILLDLPGLQWSFEQLGLTLSEHLSLRAIEDIYEVEVGNTRVRFFSDMTRTAAVFDQQWPGSGKRY